MTKLDPKKQQIIDHVDGPLLVIAGPGAGKTTAIVERIVNMLQKGVRPENMLVSTFTEKAAKELVTRVSDRLVEVGLGDKISLNEMYIGTMHSIFLDILKDYAEYTDLVKNYKILDEFDQMFIVYDHWKDFESIDGIEVLSPPETQGENHHPRGRWSRAGDVCRYINKVREEMPHPEKLANADELEVRAMWDACKVYGGLLSAINALDFSDIQSKMLEMITRHKKVLADIQKKIRYLIIDEYQDTNSIQQEILLKLAGGGRAALDGRLVGKGDWGGNICVVGDEDQSIYRFRGASVKNILTFEKNFTRDKCKKVILETNYRSHPDIVKFYNDWMDGISWTRGEAFFRYPKHIVPNPEKKRPDYPGVIKVTGESVEDWCERVYVFIDRLRKEKVVKDVNQIAFLFSSVQAENPYNRQPTDVKRLMDFLESKGIGVFSPRSGQYFQQDVVKYCVGFMVLVLPDALALNAKLGTLDMRGQPYYRYYVDCKDFLDRALTKKENAPLKKWIKEKREELDDLVGSADYSFLSLFYRALQFPLFKQYLVVEKVDGTPQHSRDAYNLGMFTQILSKFEYTFGINVFKDKYLKRNITAFFSKFMRFLYNGGMQEFEDYDETIPSGCVSVMTIHQSKGLEFPVTVVGSLCKTPRSQFTRLDRLLESKYFHDKESDFEPLDSISDFDFWRLYYVAFSRPQNLLVLTGAPGGRGHSVFSTPFVALAANVPEWTDQKFKSKNLQLKTVRAAKVKKDYAFTTDITAYERCPTQYMAFSHLGFAAERVASTMFGSLVHQTIEDVHKAFKRDETITDEKIEAWFNANYESLILSLKAYLDPKRKQDALRQVKTYYQRSKSKFSQIVEAEFDVSVVQKDYILHGVIDLLRGDGDSVEIVDFKTDKIPNMKDPEDKARVENYRRQLETYAQIVEKKYGKKVSQLHLYYTRAKRGEEPKVTFPYDSAHAKQTLKQIDAVVAAIEAHKFSNAKVKKCQSLCGDCDMRFYCGYSTSK